MGIDVSRAQMQEFANLPAEVLAGREGLAVQFDGMCMNVKVEKPEHSMMATRRRISTLGCFKCANIWSYLPYQQEDTFRMPRPCYAEMQLCGGGRFVKRIIDPATWDDFWQGVTGTISDQRTMGTEDTTTWRQCNNTRGRVSQILCLDSVQHVSRFPDLSEAEKLDRFVRAHWCKTSGCRSNSEAHQIFTRRRCSLNVPTQLSRTSLATMSTKLHLRSKNGASFNCSPAPMRNNGDVGALGSGGPEPMELGNCQSPDSDARYRI